MKKDKDKKFINIDEMKVKLKPPFHTDSVIYPDGRTSDRDDDETLFPELDLWNEEQVANVTDQLLPMLQDMIRKQNLTGADVLAALAQLSAAHIHSMQGIVNGPEEKDAVESAYYKILDYYLAAFDANDLLNEVEKMKRERMN